ncbi:acyltransferase family protein [Qipengyuania sp. CAU 1752]
MNASLNIDRANLSDRSGLPHRFAVLDSLRGLSACAVVFFHFNSSGMITGSAFARGSWMFVDFFFVLSGFVIYASYGERLREGFSISRFMGLRMGRIYPMYLLVLAAYLVPQLLLLLAQSPAREPFTGIMRLDLLALNLTLTQIFGIVDRLGWNGPGWSIAAEMWAYLLMAMVLRLFPRNPWPAVAAVCVSSLAILAVAGDPWLNSTYVNALPRCLFGFALGMALYRFALPGQNTWSLRKASVIEILATALCVVTVTFAQGPTTLLVPVVFGLAILVFAREAGWLSRILSGRSFLLLGALSYSIYIVHMFVQICFMTALRLAERYDVPWTVGFNQFGALTVVSTPWVSDLLTLTLLAGVVGVAYATYHLVEAPMRRWSRAALAQPRSDARQDESKRTNDKNDAYPVVE